MGTTNSPSLSESTLLTVKLADTSFGAVLIARALAVQPRLLMLDEPLGGMNADEMTFTLEIMAKMQKQGMTILVIEHNMQILDLCNQVVAINFGQNICTGCVEEVRSHPEVIKAYLGDQEAD